MAHSCNNCCSGKAMNIAYSECVFVALGISHAMHMRHIVMCGLLYHIFPHYLTNGTIFTHTKKSLNTKCVLWLFLQLSSGTFLILRRNEWDVIKTYIGLHVKYCVGIVFFTVNAGLLARRRYSEGPVTGHLDTGFSWFPCAKSKCWDGSQHSKLPLHASHVALLT